MSVRDVVDVGTPVEDAARRLFGELIAVADGKLTKAAINGHREFAINRIGPTFWTVPPGLLAIP